MLKAKRLTTDSSGASLQPEPQSNRKNILTYIRPSTAGTKTHRHPFWKTASAPVAAPPPVSEAETIKTKAASKPSVVGIVRTHHQQAQPVTQSTSASNTTYSRQNPASSSFHVVRANQQATTPVVASTVAATAPAPSRVQAPIPVPQQQQQQASAFANKNINKSNPPIISKPGSSAVHRVSVQSLNSVNTASTSRSSFEHISAENLEHSWGSGATNFSTAPSSTFPQKSTDSLVRIPAATSASATSELRDQQTTSASRRFPLVESDSQRKPVEPSSKTHGDTQGEQASNALPLPNSEYESPARVRSLRRSKPNINLSSTSVRDATSTAGRQSPAPGPSSIIPTSSALAAAASAVKSPEPQEHHHHHHQRSKSDMLAITELAYVRPPHRMEEHVRGGSGDHGRATLLARVMATSSTKHTQSPSTASARAMPATTTHAPRVSSHSQQANPNMTKLKQTSIPRISTSGIATASPMIEQTRQFDSLQSPLKASADHSLSAWTSVKSPTMTSSSSTNPAAAYSTLTSASVMSPNLSSVTSPRTLVSGSHHHSDVAAITPAQQHYSLSSSASSVASSSAVSSSTITRAPYVEADYDSPSSTATPGTPASNTVRALFSSFTSRSHRNSTPHPPIRGSSLSNPPITAQEVDSPRVAPPAHILSPPPLPPQSTRPDAPQQSFTALHHAQIQAQQEQLLHQQLFNTISSPRHGTPDLRTSVQSSSRPSADSRRELGGLRSPSPNSILRSYGLAANSTGSNNAVQSPSVNAQKALMGTPLFHSPRTLMSDAEVTTVTHVSITRSTVVMPADQAVAYGHSIERRNSSSSSRNSPVVSTNSRGGNGSQQQLASSNMPSQTPQSPLSQSQPVQGGFFGIFRPKSPRHPFPRAESPAPAPPPVPSKTPPPRTATASPSGRRFAFSLPINLRHKPKKSISGASVEARVGTPGGDGPMSSQGSLLLQSRTPEVHFSELPAGHGGQTENGRRTSSVMGQRRSGDAMETDTEFEDGGEDDDQPIEMKMREVQQWSQTIEANWATSGKRRSRPGVSFDVPASESERDDTGMTAVSVAPGGGRMLRYARAHARQHQQFSQQFSDNESLVVY